jgi:hypothetical protein
MEKVTVLNLRVGAWLPFGNSAVKPSASHRAPAPESELSPVYYAPIVYYQPVNNVEESAQMPEYARACVKFQSNHGSRSGTAVRPSEGETPG